MWLCLWIVLLVDGSASATPDFDTQVMPILTKAGCNAGACHGAAAGRGGFHLSLYGSRPVGDFDQITLALEGRRIDRLHAERSLLLQKPTEQLSHEGGTRLEIDGRDHQTLQKWIQGGAKRSRARRLLEFTLRGEGLETIAVAEVVPGRSQVQLIAEATFSDGTTDDVLPWTVLTPDDPSSVSISSTGLVTLQRPGRHLIIARFLDQVRPLEFIVPFSSVEILRRSDQSPDSIDDFIDVRLAELGLSSAPAADDFTFIRRVTLDLTGRLPAPSEVLQFASDAAADKRSLLVDQLLQSEAFVDFWGHRMALLFRVGQLKGDTPPAKQYYRWLRRCVKDDVPFTHVARQLLLAEGSVTDSGPASFYNVVGEARTQAELVSQVFMGVRMQCANCHDHPLDAWTQDDYHGLAAVFARIKRGDMIRVGNTGDVIHPVTGEPAVPKIPGGPYLSADADHRATLATWMTSADNAWFANSIVNRVWSHLLGRGLVDPVDDLRVTNPATHPELLNWLAQDFAEHDYQLRHLIRRICMTRVYARGATIDSGEPVPSEFYASAITRPLSPEVFMDAFLDVNLVVGEERVLDRAVSLEGVTHNSNLLESLGRCADSCESPLLERSDLTVQLQLLNGFELNQSLNAHEGFLIQALQLDPPAETFINDCYLRLYSRFPHDEEMTFWKRQFLNQTNRDSFTEVAQDMLWSLLNSDEFCTNH